MMLLQLPTLQRSFISRNTRATIEDRRAVLAAEERYRKATGSFGSLDCLGAPAMCLEAASPSAGSLPPLDREVASLQPRFGFARHLAPGPPPCESPR
jgi:hypothetical protein